MTQAARALVLLCAVSLWSCAETEQLNQRGSASQAHLKSGDGTRGELHNTDALLNNATPVKKPKPTPIAEPGSTIVRQPGTTPAVPLGGSGIVPTPPQSTSGNSSTAQTPGSASGLTGSGNGPTPRGGSDTAGTIAGSHTADDGTAGSSGGNGTAGDATADGTSDADGDGTAGDATADGTTDIDGDGTAGDATVDGTTDVDGDGTAGDATGDGTTDADGDGTAGDATADGTTDIDGDGTAGDATGDGTTDADGDGTAGDATGDGTAGATGDGTGDSTTTDAGTGTTTGATDAGTGTTTPPQVDQLEGVTAFTDTEASAYLLSRCESCHGAAGAYSSWWKVTAGYGKQDLAVDPMAVTVFQTLYRSVFPDADGPSPMPSGANPQTPDAESRQKMVRWMVDSLPSIAATAKEKYDNTEVPVPEFEITYECANPKSVAEFATDLIADTLELIPVRRDLIREFGNIDAPITLEQRQTLVAKLNDPRGWRDRFLRKGVRRFAYKFSGASQIADDFFCPADTNDDNPCDTPWAADIKDEFYNKILTYYNDLDFRTMLLDNKVRVTSRTADMYGCEADEFTAWSTCEMEAPRGSFFTTYTYLASVPSSFLANNNNFGRVAAMHFTINGKIFKSATSGPVGNKINPLPSCFQTKDYRGDSAPGGLAPTGAAKIPATGNVCQGCHIGRQLSTGSLVFRPFAAQGGIIARSHIRLVNSPYRDSVAYATGPDKMYATEGGIYEVPHRVTPKFLKDLLDIGPDAEQACVPGGNPDGSDFLFYTVGELAEYLVGSDGKVLSEGLARHIPKAMSNVPETTTEIMTRMEEAWNESGGLLPKLFEAYFLSESYACKP